MLISTGDKDMAQLVNENITLVNTMTGSVLDISGVVEKFGVAPERMIDYLALTGDNVDNIPGVANVGPKTAVKWLNQYGTLDKIIESAQEIKGKVGENLKNTIPDLPLYKELVTIKTDCKLAEIPNELKLAERDQAKLIEYFTNLEFKNWLAELLQAQTTTTIKHEYQTITDKKSLDTLINQIINKKTGVITLQTTAAEGVTAELVGIAVAVESVAAYIPLAHNYADAPQQLSIQAVLTALQPVLENHKITIIGHNIKHLREILKRNAILFKANSRDTLIESYVLNSGGSKHDLYSLSLKYLGRNTTKLEDLIGKGVKQKIFNSIEIPAAAKFAAEEAEINALLHQQLYEKITQDKGLTNIYHEIDMPLVSVLANMESCGVLVDAKMLNKQSMELNKRIKELEKEAYAIAGCEFNLSSPKQLQEILFAKLQLPSVKKTAGGQPSTAEEVLLDLALEYPLPKIILEHRSLCKLKSTYTDRLPEQINPNTGRVHTTYNQAVTNTGRLSSNNPNLQNIPIRNEEGRKIRKAFISAPGSKIIAADYSQIELRIIAHVSKDPGLLHAFNKGLDIHRATAAEVFNVEFNAVTDQQRRFAKTINFGLLYGMSAFGLSQNLNIERQQAQKYMDLYFERYPNVQKYMEETRKIAEAQGYVESLFGRRIYVPEIHSSNIPRRRAAERQAINAPMQSSAADIIKMAMICVDQWIESSELPVKMIMQVHDELVLEAEDSAVDVTIAALRECMEKAAKISVPLLVEIGVGKNWDEAH